MKDYDKEEVNPNNSMTSLICLEVVIHLKFLNTFSRIVVLDLKMMMILVSFLAEINKLKMVPIIQKREIPLDLEGLMMTLWVVALEEVSLNFNLLLSEGD